MIGIVIVSHSARLADGVVELAREMAGPDAPIAPAGGLDMPERPLGTDAVLVMNAIEQVYSDDGVLVLMDLGSAILSAELALDLLDPERRARVRMCSAPLVEGAIAAAVQARLGSPLEQIATEATNALAPKIAHLDQAPPAAPVSETSSPEAPQSRLNITVRNRLGLHARPAARLVQTVGQYQATVQVRNVSGGRGPVSARSINAVATLGVRQNDALEVTASGPDAHAVLDAIRALADNNFGDTDQDRQVGAGFKPAPTGSSLPKMAGNTLQGIPASPGLAIGPAHAFRLAVPEVPQYTAADPQAEWDALTAAIQQTRAQIQRTRTTINNANTAGIFDAHLLFLDDDALLAPTRRAVFEDKSNAASAWNHAVEAVAAAYRALDDAYLRARAADIQEVGQQVLVHLLDKLLDKSSALPVFTEPGILIAADLAAADVAHLDPANVRGICTAFGGATSHGAILARTLNIPLIVGLGDAILNVPDSTPVIMDGDTGRVILNPDEVIVRDYTQRMETQRAAQVEALAASVAPAITRDGRRIEIVANIGSVADAQAAVRMGAEGVGVLRTEFLFLNRQTAPGEDEQYTAYRAIAQTLSGRPLIIRTLDVGGDKPLPYIDQPNEANPFLGMRAIRLCLAQPDLFKTQLRAAARTAAEFPVKVMFPMIATLGEFRAAKALLAEVCAEVNVAPAQIETGIMVEIPAAALRADQFAPEVDFFSIGTNDLTQYTLAAERGNPQLATLTDAFQPAVLQLIRQVVEAAHARGKWVGVCGELGGDPLAVPLLVGLGVDELSMNAPAIPRVKQIIRALDSATVSLAAFNALALESSEAVRAAAHLLLNSE